MPNKVFTKKQAGCYADSARGIYIGQDVVIPMAENYGFVLELCDCEYCHAHRLGNIYDTGWEISRCEWYNEIWDEAENRLNTLCEDGIYFGSTENGDWGLWLTKDEEDGDETHT